MNSFVQRSSHRGHHGAIYDIAWSRSHQSWITAGGDGIVALWNVENAENGKAILQHPSAFYCAIDWERHVVAGNASGELFFVNPDGHKVSNDHDASVFSLFVDDGNCLWTGDGNGIVKRWIWWDNAPRCELSIETGLGKVRDISACPDGLLLSGESGSWQVVSKEGQIIASKTSHDGSCYWALYVPEKHVILSGGKDGMIHALDWRSQKEIVALPIHQGAIYRGLRQGPFLWTASRDRDVKIWDLSTLDPVGKLTRPHTRSVNAMALGGADETLLATGGDDRTLKIWDVSDVTNQLGIRPIAGGFD